LLAHGRGQQQELAREHAERRHAEDGKRTQDQPPADRRAGHHQAADVVHQLRARFLGGVTDGEEDRGLGERVDRHVQQGREVGNGTADAEAKVMIPMCSIDE